MSAPVTNSNGLSSGQQDALDLMTQTLTSWGLSGLVGDLKTLILNGDTQPDTLSLALSQTPAFKQRFKANDARVAAGLPALSPAQYIATEEQYHQVLQSYGLPAGFYDSTDDFTDFLSKDISPTELDSRAKIAHDQYLNAPDATKALWQSYGFTKGDAIAGILDPSVASSVIQDRANQVALGGTAAQHGFALSQSRAQQFNQAGVTLAQAQQAYTQIAQTAPTDSTIAARFGNQFTQGDEENSALLGDAAATTKREMLYQDEQGLFKGRASADAATLGVSQSY